MDTATLIKQLGTALPMMGANHLVAGDADLTFKIGRNTKGVTHIKITLQADDTYAVEAIRFTGRNWKQAPVVKGTVEGVYADQLHTVLESLTGLYTRL